MVLSRKKLKKKFRSLLAESLAANESKDSCKDASGATEVNNELQSVRELLVTKSRKPELLKREKRRKKKPVPEDLNNGDGSSEAREGNVENEDSMDLKEKSKDKKRKRVEDGGQELEEGFKQEEQKLAKKKKDKQKKKKRREKKLEKKGKKRVLGQGEENNGEEIVSTNAVNKIPEALPVQKVDESEVKKVYVGGIPYYSSVDDIRSFFEDCGTVTEVDCMTFPETGKFRGIAILSFKTEGAAKRALALDGSDMGGFFLKIQPYKASRNQKSDFAPEIIDGYNRIYVGNLSWDISEDDLKQLFSDCKISSIRFGTDKETGDFKGYAHVDFADSVSLTIALKLDQKVVCGRPVKVRCAMPRKSGQTESGSRSYDKQQESNQVGDGSSAGKSKKKRRTCYECGTPGHLSSECPQKRAGGDPVSVS
ncbi:hypothetical protein KFK09_010464 [Dendrobium nobile]|uniref:Protein gar2 n=1 Tax=Dendrobium nobile TaxID=94219 RepID=A0A8T3BC25_DENNO|nr:hypothetical protein KFK09_010464 [Dendrobium nobile]